MEGEESETEWRVGMGEGGERGVLPKKCCSRRGDHTSSYCSGAFDPDPGKTEQNSEEAKPLPR